MQRLLPACSTIINWRLATSSATWIHAAFLFVCQWPRKRPMLSIEAAKTAICWDERGLIPAVVQDSRSNAVLMVAWMNAEALQKTEQTGEAHFWSRSRGELWHKGATSGNIMRVVEIRIDCDEDTLLLRVDPAGPACHTGATSCFYRTLEDLRN